MAFAASPVDAGCLPRGNINLDLYLARYARSAKATNLKTIIYGVSTLGLAEAPIDYIGGEAIAHALEAPKNAYHWNPPLRKQVA